MNYKVFGQIGLILLCIYWSGVLFATYEVGDTPWIFPDFANLIFHEAGHYIFWPLGEFMHILGGSLTQCLIPLICLVAFLRQAQFFSAAFCLFWFGDNLMSVSYYAGDAQAQAVQLISDDALHDWHELLTMLNALPADHIIASILHIDAVLACVGAIVWMSWVTLQSIRTGSSLILP